MRLISSMWNFIYLNITRSIAHIEERRDHDIVIIILNISSDFKYLMKFTILK